MSTRAAAGVEQGIAAALEQLAAAASQAAGLAPVLAQVAVLFHETLERGGMLLLAGNGGSAAQAQHAAAEYVVRYRARRQGLAAICLSADAALLTAAGNDLGFEQVFARQVEAIGRPGDLLVLHSTTGQSPNLLAAARAARARGLRVVAMLDAGGGELRTLADIAVLVPATEPSRVQELQLAIQHAIIVAVESMRTS